MEAPRSGMEVEVEIIVRSRKGGAPSGKVGRGAVVARNCYAGEADRARLAKTIEETVKGFVTGEVPEGTIVE